MGRTARRRRQKLKQLPKPSSNLGSDPTFIKLCQWMTQNGWSPTCKLTLGNFSDTGRGLRAQENLKTGRTIVSIPTELMITTTTVAHSDIGWIFTEGVEVSEFKPTVQDILATFLVWERSKANQSVWAPYIQTIPTQFSMPAFCTTEEVSYLPNFLSEPIAYQKEDISEAFQWLYRLISPLRRRRVNYPENRVSISKLESFDMNSMEETAREDMRGRATAADLLNVLSYDAFKWAWCAVNSRCIYFENLEIDQLTSEIETSDTSCLALAPLLDLFNHNNEAKVTVTLCNNGETYELQTLVPFKKHSEVFIHYGSHPNSKLYLDYGFFLPDNRSDTIELTFEDVLYAVQRTFPADVDCSTAKYKFIKSHQLKQDLSLHSQGLSYNTIALIFVLLSPDISNRMFYQKVFSRTFDYIDKSKINAVGQILVKTKKTEMENRVIYLENLKHFTPSYKVAKDLMKEYVNMLQRSLSYLEQTSTD